MLTRDQVEKLIQAGLLPAPGRDRIASGSVKDCRDGQRRDWAIELGPNFLNAAICQASWTNFTIDLIDRARKLPDADRVKALSTIDAEHTHWDWVSKSKHYQQNEYRWFFLLVENSVEAVCLTYHPKNSAIDGDKVFYIEYIAVAPWNKSHHLIDRRFSGIGSLFIIQIQNYFNSVDGYRFGFCLHSLPQAESYYRHIGMTEFPGHEKDNLAYFEMDASTAQVFCGGAL